MQDPLAVSNFLALSRKSFAIKFDLENTEYDAIENIGTGAYGVVCSAVHRRTGERVAIKKIPKIFEQMIVAMRTYREIRILRHFQHNNVISIREILRPKEDLPMFQDIYIVLDLMESDLHRIIYSQQELTNDHIRWFLYQILRGLKYIHSANVVHRDLKPSNLLVNGNCDLKIGDFGMARGIYSVPDDSNIKMTQYVATRWYRAPEIILQSPTYTTGVDVWSVGCILAEMIMRKPLFPGRDYRHQLEMVFDVVGTPSAAYVDTAHSELIKEFLVKFPKKPVADFAELFPGATPKAIRLLRRFLSLDPKDRLTVMEALQDPYLSMYHEPDDEPICTPPFDFSFEKQFKDLFDKKELQSKILRDVISKEILDYHAKTRSDDTAGGNFNPSSAPTDQGAVDQPNNDRWQSLDQQLDLSDNKNSESSAIVSELNQTIDLANKYDVAFDSVDGATNRSVLKIEITPASNDNHHPSSGDCIEMRSARGDGGMLTVNQHQQQDQLDSDVRMLSAKLEEKCIITSIEEESAIVPCNDKDILSELSSQLDAKAKIKAALLNTELRKQRIELSQKLKTPSKPRAAIQMQKKREEKRRLKQEKALERKKKKGRDVSSPKGSLLTDEDRTLLERWQSMQKSSQNQQQQSNYIPSSSNCSTNAFQNHCPTQGNTPTSTSYAGLLTNGGSLARTVMNGLMPVTDSSVPSRPITFNASTPPSLLNCIPSSVDPPTGAPTLPPSDFGSRFVPMMLPTGRSPGLGPMPGYPLMPGSYSNDLPRLSVPRDPVLWLPSAVKGPSDLQAMNTHNCLPSYSEALAAKHFDSDRYSLNRQMLPLTGLSDTLKYSLDRQESQGFTLNGSESVGILPEFLVRTPASKCDGLNQSLARLSSQSNEIQVSTSQPVSVGPSLSGYLRGGDGSLGSLFQETMVDPLHIVTNRSTKSHLEDLTVQTPRGTGFGYGVGVDLSSFIASTGTGDNRGINEGPESAPLSAQLMADWRFVTGDMDANDFEVALQLDFPEMESCLNLSDFNSLS